MINGWLNWRFAIKNVKLQYLIQLHQFRLYMAISEEAAEKSSYWNRVVERAIAPGESGSGVSYAPGLGSASRLTNHSGIVRMLTRKQGRGDLGTFLGLKLLILGFKKASVRERQMNSPVHKSLPSEV